MVEWMIVMDLVFEEPPSVDVLAAANAWMRSEDEDVPRLTTAGWRGQAWRSPMVGPETLVTQLAALGIACRLRVAQNRASWGGAERDTDATLGVLAAQPWLFSPRSKSLTMAEAAGKFAEMGGTWTGEEVAAALRAMGVK